MLFEIGDYIRYPDGVGEIVYVEEVVHYPILEIGCFECQEVEIKPKYSTSGNPDKTPMSLYGSGCHLITKEEYDKEEDF